MTFYVDWDKTVLIPEGKFTSCPSDTPYKVVKQPTAISHNEYFYFHYVKCVVMLVLRYFWSKNSNGQLLLVTRVFPQFGIDTLTSTRSLYFFQLLSIGTHVHVELQHQVHWLNLSNYIFQVLYLGTNFSFRLFILWLFYTSTQLYSLFTFYPTIFILSL